MSPKYVGLLVCIILAGGSRLESAAFPARSAPPPERVNASEIQFMSPEELKTKVSRNQPVTIIDVRTSESFATSDRKIKGAVHVKLRRLKYRLSFAPLKDVPRDNEVVTYCACPNDELSIQAAQLLLESGFKRVRVLKGGWQAWLKLKGPIESALKVP